MENEREKSREKMVGVGVWLREENERNFGRAQEFSLRAHQKQLPQIGEKNMREKENKSFGQKCPN